MSDIEAKLGNLPDLHIRLDEKGDPFFASGGFTEKHLIWISDVIDQHIANVKDSWIIETGAGLSTIMFLAKQFKTVTTIAPDLLMERNLYGHCVRNDIDASSLDFRPNRSEHELPKIAESLGPHDRYDVAFIDGDHGWPNVFVDFCYMNYMLRTGGLLFLDDCNVYPVKELANFLEAEGGFEKVAELSKITAFKRTTAERFTSGAGRPYLKRKTDEMNQ